MASARNIDLINVRLPLEDEGQLYRLSIRDGRWAAVTPQEATAPIGAVPLEGWRPDTPSADASGGPTVLDLEGKAALPGLVDAHMHLDKSFSLPAVGNVSGTLEEAVRNYSQASPAFTGEDIKARIVRSGLQALSFGTTLIRTHLDFNLRASREVALRTIEAALEAKAKLAPYVALQLFPMCPYNMTAADAEVVEEALRMGVDGIGGAPHLSMTPAEDIDRIFALAAKYDLPVDLHCDESDDPRIRTVLHIAERTIAEGYGGRVTVDHLCSLAAMTDEDAALAISRMAEAKLTAVSLPAVNLYLQGRHDRQPVRRGVTRLREIADAGIPIAVASDNIHDPFHPFGRGDLLQIALVSSYAAHMGRPADLRTLLHMITDVPARVLGRDDYGIAPGNPARFVVFDGQSPEELFTLLPERRWVYNEGAWLRLAPPKALWSGEPLAALWREAAGKAAFRQPGVLREEGLPYG